MKHAVITRPLPITEEFNRITEANGNNTMTMDEIDAEIAACRIDNRHTA